MKHMVVDLGGALEWEGGGYIGVDLDGVDLVVG